MAVSYRGLTIKFGGDTTELQSALKKIQTETKNTQSDLKEINKSLKFNPGNTELLEQKVRKLNSAYQETKTKLDAYKQAMQQLEDKKARGEQLTEEEQRQYDSLQRSILKCENQLETYAGELKQTTTEMEASKTGLYRFGQTLEDNAERFKRVGDAMKKAGQVMIGVSTAITGVTLAAFNQVDAGYDAVIKATGATGEAAQELSENVRNVATTVAGAQYEWEQIGSTVGEVATRFGATGEELESLSELFFEFSTITDVDVVKAVQNADKAMEAFNVDASETENVLGVVAKTAQDTGISADYLMEALVANGATFRELGLDIDDAVVMLGRFEAAGIPADQMLAGLKKAAANCADSGEDLSEVLTDLTERLQDPATQAEATQEAIDLFGSRAAMAFIDAAKTGRISFSDLEQTLGNYGSVVGDTFGETVDGIDQSAVAMKELQAAGADLGGVIGETLAPIIREFAGFVRDVSSAFNALSPEQKEFIAKAVLMVGAAGGVTLVFGNLFQVVGQVGGVLKTCATGWSSLTGLIAANPIALGVAAVAVAVAGLTWFFTQTETGKQLWADFTGWISEKWQAVQDFFAGIPEFWGGLWDSVTATVDNARSQLGQSWDAVKDKASEAWGSVQDEIARDMESAHEAATHSSSALQAALSGDWETAKAEAGLAFEAIQTRISEKMAAARQAVIDAANRIGEKLGFPGLGNAVFGVFDGIRTAIRDKMDAARDAVSGAIERIKGLFNFRISWPHIPMPHFNWHWESIGGILSLPHFDGISWYATGGAIEPNNPHLIGVGDSNEREWIEPESKLVRIVEDAMRRVSGAGASPVSVEVNVKATITGRQSAYEIGQDIGRGISSTMKQRGYIHA